MSDYPRHPAGFPGGEAPSEDERIDHEDARGSRVTPTGVATSRAAPAAPEETHGGFKALSGTVLTLRPTVDGFRDQLGYEWVLADDPVPEAAPPAQTVEAVAWASVIKWRYDNSTQIRVYVPDQYGRAKEYAERDVQGAKLHPQVCGAANVRPLIYGDLRASEPPTVPKHVSEELKALERLRIAARSTSSFAPYGSGSRHSENADADLIRRALLEQPK